MNLSNYLRNKKNHIGDTIMTNNKQLLQKARNGFNTLDIGNTIY